MENLKNSLSPATQRKMGDKVLPAQEKNSRDQLLAAIRSSNLKQLKKVSGCGHRGRVPVPGLQREHVQRSSWQISGAQGPSSHLGHPPASDRPHLLPLRGEAPPLLLTLTPYFHLLCLKSNLLPFGMERRPLCASAAAGPAYKSSFSILQTKVILALPSHSSVLYQEIPSVSTPRASIPWTHIEGSGVVSFQKGERRAG
jgi:hypothetical protein